MRVVFHILAHGRPIKAYGEFYDLLSNMQIPELSSRGWSDATGWNYAEAIGETLRQHQCKILHGSAYLGASLDESEGFMFVHAYTVNSQFEREHIFIGLPRIEGKLDASCLRSYAMLSLASS